MMAGATERPTSPPTPADTAKKRKRTNSSRSPKSSLQRKRAERAGRKHDVGGSTTLEPRSAAQTAAGHRPSLSGQTLDVDSTGDAQMVPSGRPTTLTDSVSAMSKLPNEILSMVLESLRSQDVKSVCEVSRRMRDCGMKLLYTTVHLHLRNSTLHLEKQIDFMIEYCTTTLSLTIDDNLKAQMKFQELATRLPSLQITSLRFVDLLFHKPLRCQPAYCVLSTSSWEALERALLPSIDGVDLLSRLQSIELPTYDRAAVEEKGLEEGFSHNGSVTRALDVLDSNIYIEFEPHDGKADGLTSVRAQGRLASTRGPANGSSAALIRRLLRSPSSATSIRSFSMRGINPANLELPYSYSDMLARLNLASVRRYVSMKTFVLHGYNCVTLPSSMLGAIDLSYIKTLKMIQCANYHIIFQHFSESNANINLKHLCIRQQAMHDDYVDETSSAFEDFMGCFNTLEIINININAQWDIDMTVFANHANLHVCAIDFGSDFPLVELEDLSGNTKLTSLSYRDDLMGLAIRCGYFHEDWKQRLAELEAVIRGWAALETLQIFMEPIVKRKKRRFQGRAAGNESMSTHEIVAGAIHLMLHTDGSSLRRIVLTESAADANGPHASRSSKPSSRVFDF